MAIEWYLLKPPHDQLSGFEDEALSDFAKEGFDEVIDSEFAVDVELCNYDLSERKQIKAVVQNTVQDTKLKSLNREIYFPIGTSKAGMYVKYKNRYWLIVGLVDDNMMYEKAIMSLCNYYLTWLNDEKEIVQRWVCVSSASQYNNGETGVTYFNVRSDQLLIISPDDRESVLLTTGKRFIIDKRCRIYEKEFDADVVSDTSKPVVTYRVTRSDSVLYDYQDSGHFEFMVYQDEQREKDGYYVIDGIGYWLCEEVSDSPNKSEVLSSEILYDSTDIYNGLEPGVFTAQFYDAEGNKADATPHWDIVCDFKNQLNIEYVDNSICISVDNKSLINKSFELSLSADGYDKQSITITIKAFW